MNYNKDRKKMYLWVLDSSNGKVYRYDTWNPDKQSCEDYLINKRRIIKDCKWMVTPTPYAHYTSSKKAMKIK